LTPERAVRMQRVVAMAAAVAGGVADVGYLRLISDQGTGIGARVAFIAGFVALMTALAAIGAILFGRAAAASQLVLLGSASGFLGLGLIALFSIGIALILAGVLALIGAGPLPVSGRLTAVPILGSLALLAAGFALTS
jgi:hypothetical protein